MTTPTIHAASPSRPRTAFSRHTRRLHRISFAAAQGDQPTQVHFVQAYARRLAADGVPLDLTVREALADRAQRQRLPAGHIDVDRAVIRAEFAFWWHLLIDLMQAVYTGCHQGLPSRVELDGLMHAVDGDPGMSPFSVEEMDRLARTIALYRRTDLGTNTDLVDRLLLGGVLRVEHGFQGRSARYPARPRTDGGDRHASRFLLRCRVARNNFRDGRADVDDRIYRSLCALLDQLGPGDPLHRVYRALIEDFNHNHPREPVERLHIPADAFPAEPGDAAA
ncbi:hypothetical protein ACFORH_39150 [Amycolatopsis roodepoortensis]|uniref:Uncharacterized protein n=1 Tax=Amycolatopsis roodepoortensis TaxID=700274 RepID=A0ABR9LIL3_9PSEU|nr:hypothetical protein [Amycolatopsis roodepoortensis]MBE1580534.1 hypothetical protein [Amycolatopsis roodepoortensis]